MRAAQFITVAVGLSLPSACARDQDEAAPAPPKQKVLPSSFDQDVSSMDAKAAEQAIRNASSLLDDTLTLSAPDCPMARTIRDRICDLSGHLCRLADQSPGPGMAARCEDGKRRCTSAKERVAAKCD